MNINRFNTVNLTDSTLVESRELPNIKNSFNNINNSNVSQSQSVNINKSLKKFNKNLKSINKNDLDIFNNSLNRKALNNSIDVIKQSKRNVDY